MTTGETDITSTTSDELEPEASNVPKTTTSEAVDSTSLVPEQNEVEFQDLVSSTPLKKQSSLLDVAACGTLEKPTEKRKRGRPRKTVDDKKTKTNKEANLSAPKSSSLAAKPDNTVHVHNEVKLTSHVPTRHLRMSKNAVDGNAESDKLLKRQLEFDKDLPIRKRSRLRCESTL